ncbi:uncharacterized protein N7487_006337 [Penicillium crustosum]|uniref:uncharacterized protein n=1 Tax=Penicillium crustosum TaxID=36656 RepID=UPI0023A2BECA|nr:uncharacterized protein N7487_006337 [Penicillium crustosum]KAJ5411978.1 hypothetical protein N7487_006337 [Penicillium crustosum]
MIFNSNYNHVLAAQGRKGDKKYQLPGKYFPKVWGEPKWIKYLHRPKYMGASPGTLGNDPLVTRKSASV